MKRKFTLSQANKQIANKLLESMYLLEIFEELIEGDGKLDTLLSAIKQNIKFSFDYIHKCRKIISSIQN